VVEASSNNLRSQRCDKDKLVSTKEKGDSTVDLEVALTTKRHVGTDGWTPNGLKIDSEAVLNSVKRSAMKNSYLSRVQN